MKIDYDSLKKYVEIKAKIWKELPTKEKVIELLKTCFIHIQ